MRFTYFVFVLCFLFVSTLCADDFANFRIPAHRVYSVTGGISGSYDGSRDNTPNSQTHHWSTDGTLNGNGYWLWDSDPLWLKAEVYGSGGYDAYGSGTRNSSSQIPPIFNQVNTSRETSFFEYLTMNLEGRAYPFALPIGVGGNLRMIPHYHQKWQTTDERTDYPAERSYNTSHERASQWFYDYRISGSVEAGYGRVRDATAIYTVAVLEQRLLATGDLTRPLSESARQRLASLFYFRYEFSNVHLRPSKFFWQDVETILREDGALRADHIEAYGLYRADEPLLSYSSTLSRECGWFIGLTATGDHTHTIDRLSTADHDVSADSTGIYDDRRTSNYSRTNDEANGFDYGLSVEFHRPFGLRWQFDGTSSLQTTALTHPDVRHPFVWESQLGVTYIIADRWQASVDFEQSREVWETRYGTGSIRRVYDNWSTFFEAALTYFVEDHITANAMLRQSQSAAQDGYIYYNGTSQRNPYYHRSYSISLGLSYHFLGSLEAPGIVPRSTLMR